VALLEDVYRSYLRSAGSNERRPRDRAHRRDAPCQLPAHAGYALATVRARPEAIRSSWTSTKAPGQDHLPGRGAFDASAAPGTSTSSRTSSTARSWTAARLARAPPGPGEFAYEIVPVPTSPRPGRSRRPRDGTLSMGAVRPGRPYELHILVQPGRFPAGNLTGDRDHSVQGGAIGGTYNVRAPDLPGRSLRRGRPDAGSLRQKLDGRRTSFTSPAPWAKSGTRPPRSRACCARRCAARELRTTSARLNSRASCSPALAASPSLPAYTQVRASLGGGIERRLLYSLEPAAGRTPVFGSDYDVA